MIIEVFSRDDPSREGQIVAGPKTRSDGDIYRVRWNDGLFSWVPEYAFDRKEDVNVGPFELLEQERFGRQNDLRRNLTFIQLSGQLANVVYSMDTTNTKFLPYQYKPVLTFLESPSNGILIADEVGLGKTIEAGLIWTELRARYDVRRVVVVCPAMLCDKWMQELDTKFGIEASQLSATELAKKLREKKHRIPAGRGYVCSLQGLRPPKDWKNDDSRTGSSKLADLLDDLKQEEPAIDLLVIDEAHHLRNRNTRSAELGRLLREVSEHVVLLSATPVNNRSDDLYELLHLIDADSFDRREQFPEILAANEPLIQARNLVLNRQSTSDQIHHQLQIAAVHPLLRENQQLKGLLRDRLDARFLNETANRVKLADRIERINLLRHTVSRTRKTEVNEFKIVREAKSYFASLDPSGPERYFYNLVTKAVREYARQRDVSDGFLLCQPQRQMSSCMYAAARSWRERGIYADDAEAQLYEDMGTIRHPPKEVGRLIQHIVSMIPSSFDVDSLLEHDAKFNQFQAVVTDYLANYPDKKLIVFSYFKLTLGYLGDRLAELGIPSQVLHGEVAESKQGVIKRFRQSDDTRILLTSEIASEGVDLQFCSLLVNYDLPWNPMKIEQRIGRIDRIGQEAAKVLIWNMGYADTIDERIYELLFQKLRIFERALGSMEDVLGKQIAELTNDLFSHDLTSEQERVRIEQTRIAVENVKHLEDKLEASAGHLIAHGGYILERVRAAHESSRRITGDDLKAFIKDYLDRYSKGFAFQEDDRDPLVATIRLPPGLANNLDDFMKENGLQGQSRLAAGEKVRCKFLNKVDRATPKLEVISQFHPLIRFVSENLKQRSEALYPLVAITVSRTAELSLAGGMYAFASQLWEFTGLRTDRVLHSRSIWVEGDADFLDADESSNLLNVARLSGSDWLSVAQEVPLSRLRNALEKCDMKLLGDYEIEKRDRDNENADRVTLQKLNAESHRDRLLANQRELLERYRKQERHQLIPMTEGKIEKIASKFDLRLERLSRQRNLAPRYSEVCHGVIRVVD